MIIHILTIFPESFESHFSTSIMKNAISEWKFLVNFYKLNNYSELPTKRVDNKAYGMHWQVLSPLPLEKWIKDIFSKVGKKIPVIYMTPSWNLLNQELVEWYYDKLQDEFIIICGHYEWIDQRIIDEYVDYQISIWEYVLTSWEIAASVFIDSLVRHIPWVLWNSTSLEEDSFSKKFNRQKEYPVYTRPEIFNWKEVPNILLSWDHKKIEEWKNDNLR